MIEVVGLESIEDAKLLFERYGKSLDNMDLVKMRWEDVATMLEGFEEELQNEVFFLRMRSIKNLLEGSTLEVVEVQPYREFLAFVKGSYIRYAGQVLYPYIPTPFVEFGMDNHFRTTILPKHDRVIKIEEVENV